MFCGKKDFPPNPREVCAKARWAVKFPPLSSEYVETEPCVRDEKDVHGEGFIYMGNSSHSVYMTRGVHEGAWHNGRSSWTDDSVPSTAPSASLRAARIKRWDCHRAWCCSVQAGARWSRGCCTSAHARHARHNSVSVATAIRTEAGRTNCRERLSHRPVDRQQHARPWLCRHASNRLAALHAHRHRISC